MAIQFIKMTENKPGKKWVNSALHLKIKQVLCLVKGRGWINVRSRDKETRRKRSKPSPFGSSKLLIQPSQNMETYSTK